MPKVAALPESDFTAKIVATGLPSDQDIFYRVKFQDLSDTTVESEPLIEDEVVLVGPLRLAGRRLRARELEAETWISRDEGRHLRRCRCRSRRGWLTACWRLGPAPSGTAAG